MIQSVFKPSGSNTSFGKMTCAMMALRRRMSTGARMRSMLHKLLGAKGEACRLGEMPDFVAIARRRTAVMLPMLSMLPEVVSTNESGAAFQKMFRTMAVMAIMTVW